MINELKRIYANMAEEDRLVLRDHLGNLKLFAPHELDQTEPWIREFPRDKQSIQVFLNPINFPAYCRSRKTGTERVREAISHRLICNGIRKVCTSYSEAKRECEELLQKTEANFGYAIQRELFILSFSAVALSRMQWDEKQKELEAHCDGKPLNPGSSFPLYESMEHFFAVESQKSFFLPQPLLEGELK